MKELLVTILVLLTATSYASQKAITDTGEEVILKSDGTWEYSNDSQRAVNKIEISKKKFKRPESSSFLLKSSNNKSAFWINTKKWSFKKSKKNVEAEYEFHLKSSDLHGMSITEEVEISIEYLIKIALENAQAVAPDAKIVRQEYRIVNGHKVIYLEISGSMQGIEFTYFGYFYSDSSGTTQFIAYTGTNLADKYRSEINDFLNGFDKQ
jgi:hypothetical protein